MTNNTINQTVNPTILASSTVSVYQTWGMGRDIGDAVRFAARKEDCKELRRLLNLPASEAYVGSFDLARNVSLEDLFVLCQNDSHVEGWVAATGAQEGWIRGQGSAPSLSVGDLLCVQNGPVESRFVVAMVGFVQL